MANLTDARSIVTDSMFTAVVETGSVQAISMCPSNFASTERLFFAPIGRILVLLNVLHCRVITDSIFPESTIIHASTLFAGRSNVLVVAHTSAIVALAKSRTIFGTAFMRAVQCLCNIVVGKFRYTLAFSSHANTIWSITVTRTGVGQTIITNPALAADTHSFDAVTVGGGIESTTVMCSTSVLGTIVELPSHITHAFAFNTSAVVGAVIGTGVDTAVKSSPSFVATTGSSITRSSPIG